MRPVAVDRRAPRSSSAVAACLAALLDLDPAAVPAPRGEERWARWTEFLAAHGLGLVRRPVTERWPGYWIALLESGGDDLDAAVFWDAVCVFDPREGERPRGEPREMLLLAVHDPARPAPHAPDRRAGVVEAIYLAAARAAKLEPVREVRAVAGRGLDGDRYASGDGTFHAPGRTGQALTLIEAEALEAAGVVTGAEARRNVVTRGIDLNALVGRRFSVGEVPCLGRRLCEPCAHLQRLTRPGVLRPLVHRAGLRADVLADGVIAVGDPVAVSVRA